MILIYFILYFGLGIKEKMFFILSIRLLLLKLLLFILFDIYIGVNIM